jgi:hypothetical protein
VTSLVRALALLLLCACGDGPVVLLDVPPSDAGGEDGASAEPSPLPDAGTAVALDAGIDSGRNEGQEEDERENEGDDDDRNEGSAGSGEEADCTVDADCSDEEERPLCDTDRAECVECRSDDDCNAAQAPLCHEEERECVRCRSDLDCPAGTSCQTDDGECE